MYFNEFSVESRPKIFNSNNFFFCVCVCVCVCVWGGGGGGLHLQHFYFLCQKPLFCWIPFNHDQIKCRTKLTSLVRMNLETSIIPPSIMLPVLSFSV